MGRSGLIVVEMSPLYTHTLACVRTVAGITHPADTLVWPHHILTSNVSTC